jgi:hypothetical protein
VYGKREQTFLSRLKGIRIYLAKEDNHVCEQIANSHNTGKNRPANLATLMTNLLLPFTHGIDVSAIAYALALAQRLRFTLVVLSLIHIPETSGTRHPRLEDIQQSKDFLVFVHQRAAKQGVPIERVELYTHHSVRSIRNLAREMECAGILLFVRRGSGVLLATGEVKQLLEDGDLPLYIVPLLPHKSRFLHPRWLPRWLNT